jgi:hypothetical protein
MLSFFFSILLVLQFFIEIFETPPCLLLLAKTLHLLYVFQLLTKCAKVSVSLGNQLSFHNKFCANLWHFYSNLSVFFQDLGPFP